MSDSVEVMADSASPEKPRRSGLKAAVGGLNAVRLWFRAFRRTRPFWGGLWTILAGLWIVRAMNFGIGLAITGGWSYSAGYTLGGALALFGLVAWFAPHYKGLVGLLAFVTALIAFVAANLGGYLVGTVLGIIGGSMIWAWGEKKPRAAKGKGKADAAKSRRVRER